MLFQLVRANDREIVVWQTEHGHIYVFTIRPDTDDLERRIMRDAPDAPVPAGDFAEEALRFATEDARVRHFIGGAVKRRRKTGRSNVMA